MLVGIVLVCRWLSVACLSLVTPTPRGPCSSRSFMPTARSGDEAVPRPLGPRHGRAEHPAKGHGHAAGPAAAHGAGERRCVRQQHYVPILRPISGCGYALRPLVLCCFRNVAALIGIVNPI